MKLGVCIIGCGFMGSWHAKEWAKRPDARVVSLFDVAKDKSLHLAETYSATAYDSLEEAVAAETVDVVSICTPAAFHPDIARFAAKHGKHVLCEKPIALTVEEAELMKQTAELHGVKLGVSLQYRGYPHNQLFRKLFVAGEFGEHLFFRYIDLREVRPKLAMHRKSMNGGPVVDMTGHFFDLARFITGEEPESVGARGYVFGEGKQRLAGIDDLAIDAADIQVFYTGGHTVSVLVNWGMPEGFPGLQQQLLVGSQLSVRSMPDDSFEAQYSTRTERWENFKPPFDGPGCCIDDLIQAIKSDTKPTVSAEDGIVALSTSLAALESIAQGRPVSIERG